MLRYRHLCYVALNVSDLSRSRAFYAGLEGLAEQASPEGVALFRVGTDRALLTLNTAASPGLKAFGFEMESDAGLDRLAAALDRHGVRWSNSETGIRMVEPHLGIAVDFFRGVAREPIVADRSNGAIAGFGHVVISTPGYRQAVAFWREALGFRLSDEIDGRISLLRCFPNPTHHSLGIACGERSRFHHLNFRAREGADLDAVAGDLAGNGTTIASGPGTHTPSGNRFVYFLDPDGLTLEISTVAERFEEGRERAPRILPNRPESFAMGNVTRHPGMGAVGEIEEASEKSG
jgi:2,3-dihydroxy-p-cumate/2,3-dihydroxybenzoate 3,4-dioxygenase